MKRKLGITIILILLLTTPVVNGALIDYYGSGNTDTNYGLQDHHPADGVPANYYSSIGQAFTAPSTFNISRVSFWMKKTLSPTGSLVAVLYAATGNVGSTAEPTGAALATSANFDVSTLGAGYANASFIFAGVDSYECQSGTNYTIVVQTPVGGTIDATNYPTIAADSSTPSNDGNQVEYEPLGSWGPQAGKDTVFYLYGTEAPTNDAVVSTATFKKDVKSWVNVTVSDVDLVADLKTVDILVNTTGDAETFTLRWTQSGGAFTEVSDTDNIITLDTVNSTRVNIDADTDKIAFYFTMTGGTDGLCNVTVTTTDDEELTDVDLFADEYTYETYTWNALYWLLDSAGDIFGFSGIVVAMTTFFEGIFLKLNTSFTNLVTLIVQFYVVIDGTFTFIVTWLTRTISLLVSIFTIVVSLLDGSHAVLTDAINVWSTMSFSEWGVQFIPILLLVYWMMSLDKRGKVQGWNTVFLGDLSTIINILSFFMSTFQFVVNTAIQAVWAFVNLIT